MRLSATRVGEAPADIAAHPVPAAHQDLRFLAGGGGMGERIRAHAWSGTSLGPPAGWPQSLRTALRVLLTSEHPVFLFWGPESLCFYNDACARSLGPEKHPSILGLPAHRAWHEVWPALQPQIAHLMSGLGTTGHPHALLPIVRHGALPEVAWTCSCSPIDDPQSPQGVGGVLVICTETTDDGRVAGTLAQGADVTARTAADRTLAMYRSRLDYATRLSGVGFWYCDLPFDVLQWDDQVKEHFFFPPDVCITIDDFYARIHEDDREPTRAAIAASVSSRSPYDIVYRTVHPATGDVKWIRALGGTDYAADGTPTHFDGVTVDVTAQKLDQLKLSRLNEQLREQDRLKDAFIATLSHELRNPLAPIRASAHVLASPQVTPVQLQRAQRIIERQARHMAMLLDDLLDIARITQGKLQLKRQTVSLFEIIDAALEAVRPALEERHHELALDLPPQPLRIHADPLRLSQVVSNLLTNAGKYSAPGSLITLAVSVVGETLQLSVTDRGVGIAPESIEHIFEMFSQVDAGAGATQAGLGIGLALVKGIAELHGGSVSARSAGLGHGSEFIVRLPLQAAAPPPAPATAPAAQATPVSRRVLIADDNADAAESLAMLLQLAGHEVRVAHLGRAALAQAQLFRPQVVLLDIGMPDLSGYDVAQQLRREPWTQGLLLIALTGWGQEADRRQALEAGFDHHLCKPVDPDQLIRLIGAAPG